MKKKLSLNYICLDTSNDNILACNHYKEIALFIGVSTKTVQRILESNDNVMMYKHYKIWAMSTHKHSNS